MEVDLFDFDLPEQLIAQTPLEHRAASRLLTLNKETGHIHHTHFEHLLDELKPGDVLVLNDTKVMPARLFGRKAETGAKAEVLLLKRVSGDIWEALVKPGKRLRVGAVIEFGDDNSTLLRARVIEEGDLGRRTLQFEYEGIFQELLDRLGHMPLPPYIKEQLEDRSRYQTVYARAEGSAAAPTAGLHFTEELLASIRKRGVFVETVTLHVGLGTFRPVSVSNVEAHQMHEEYYELPQETADRINEAKREGRRVIAVGTTSCRTLETAAAQFAPGKLQAVSGWTNIFIYPGYSFQVVDALLTNFHLPKSTLVMMVSALASREHIMRAYQEAIEREYRFFSFGDAMFIY